MFASIFQSRPSPREAVGLPKRTRWDRSCPPGRAVRMRGPAAFKPSGSSGRASADHAPLGYWQGPAAQPPGGHPTPVTTTCSRGESPCGHACPRVCLFLGAGCARPEVPFLQGTWERTNPSNPRKKSYSSITQTRERIASLSLERHCVTYDAINMTQPRRFRAIKVAVSLRVRYERRGGGRPSKQ